MNVFFILLYNTHKVKAGGGVVMCLLDGQCCVRCLHGVLRHALLRSTSSSLFCF